MQLKPHVDVSFQRGPALAPPHALVPRLNQQRRGLLRLSVIIQFEQPDRARSARPGEVSIALDDSALGISLADHLLRSCPGAPTWYAGMESLWDPSTPEIPTLQTRRFARAVSPSEAADFVEVEAR